MKTTPQNILTDRVYMHDIGTIVMAITYVGAMGLILMTRYMIKRSAQ